MSITDKLETFQFDLGFKNATIDNYIKEYSLNDLLVRGLSELYKAQPKKPIVFYATWLLNEGQSMIMKEKLKEREVAKQKLFEKKENLKKRIDEEEKMKRDKDLAAKSEGELFFQEIESVKDMESSLNGLCEKLKRLTNSTGVYISLNDKRLMPITQDSDENAHIGEADVLRFVYYSDDHAFMKNKVIEPETGVSYDVLKPDEEVPADPNPPAEGAEGAEVVEVEKKVVKPKNVFVPEVVRQSRMVFFREPRLGSWIGVNMSYRSSLSKESLVNSIECWKDYQERLKKKEERDQEKKKEREEWEKNKANNPEGEEPSTFPEEPEEIVKEEEFVKKEKRYVLACDCIGQDREYTEEERNFIVDVTMKIRDSWEQIEKNLLLKDREVRMEMIKIEEQYKSINPVEVLQENEEKAVRQYIQEQGDEWNNNPDEEQKRILTELTRYKFWLANLTNDNEAKTFIEKFADMEMVEYELIFQNILYFIGINNLSINEELTNKLFWKKARNYWNKNVLEFLNSYNPLGPKEEKVSSFAVINRLINVFKGIDVEAVKTYSVILAKLLELMNIVLNVRKDDIIRRTNIKLDLIKQRDEIIVKKNEREEKKATEMAAEREEREKLIQEAEDKIAEEKLRRQAEKEEKERAANEAKAQVEANASAGGGEEMGGGEDGGEEMSGEQVHEQEPEPVQEHREEGEGEPEQEAPIDIEVPPPFDEKAFLERFDSENQDYIIPPEVVMDIDSDYQADTEVEQPAP